MHLPLLTLPLLLVAHGGWAYDRYTARFDDALSQVEVEACFEGAAPRQLYRSSRAARFAGAVHHDGRKIGARSMGGTLRLPTLGDDSCIGWRVDLAAAAAANDYQLAFRVQDTLVVNTGLWFWKGPWQRPIEVTVELPEGFDFSTPWPRSSQVDRLRFRPEPTPSSWSSRTAVGRMATRAIDVPGGVLNLAVTGRAGAGQLDKLATWVESSARAVVPVFGQFPRPQLQVLVVPIGRRGEPVPWARVMRGGGPAVEFFIDCDRSLAEFERDWTATHEFSHLLLPYVSSRDRWLSEGLASYYQNVLRARDGRLSQMQAWQKLHEGFRRGERGTRNGTLAEVTRSGRGATMRVYWSGAAMMLKADTRLREISNGARSLDTVLRELATCCRSSGKRWRAWDLLQEMDRLSDTRIFTDIYRDHVHAEAFPDMSGVYQELGLDSRFGRIRPVEDAPLEDIREEIMAPPARG